MKLKIAAVDEIFYSSADLENTGVIGRPCSSFAVSYCNLCGKLFISFALIKIKFLCRAGLSGHGSL